MLPLCTVIFFSIQSGVEAAPRSWPARRNIQKPNPDTRYGDSAYHYATNSPELTIVRRSQTSVALAWGSEDSFDAFDIFTTVHLKTNAAQQVKGLWVWLGRTQYGETNIVITNLWPEARWFKLGSMLDSDMDGLPDTFEVIVSQTNPGKRDSDDDGKGDGEKGNVLSLPWSLEQARGNDIVLHTEASRATEGGACGRVAVYLPYPAPLGGVVVNYRTGGTAVPEQEYLTAPRGNAVTIPAGLSTGTIEVCAVDNQENLDMDRYVEFHLTEAKGYTVDHYPARVTLVENDLHEVRVFPMPPRLEKPSLRYGTNIGVFYFIRDGDSINPVTLSFSITGTAVAGVDYWPLAKTVTFAANSRTNSLRVIPKMTRDETDKTIILTLTNAPNYQFNPKANAGTITLVPLRE